MGLTDFVPGALRMKQTDAFSMIHKAVKLKIRNKNKPIRIAVNGIEGTGKTTFAVNFVEYLKARNVAAFHVSIDGFHFNKEVRYKQGRNSANGYYEDTYNEVAFVKSVLLRSQETSPEYVEATHDLETDAYLELPPTKIPNDAVLVTDGCYLFKPVFNQHWDLRVYLKTDFATALERGARRDQNSLGGYDEAKQKFISRYHAASKRYISEVSPELLADWVFDNTDFDDLIALSVT